MSNRTKEQTLQDLYYVQEEVQKIVDLRKKQINLTAKYQTAKKRCDR